jgi:CubicO group peptidase (beta-lactamase class C family)
LHALAADHSFRRARAVIASGLASRAYPASVVEVGRASRALWSEAAGRLSYASDAPPATLDTIFDLASLTKVIATASLVMCTVSAGRLALDTLVKDVLPTWNGADRSAAIVRQLLDHSSGLAVHAKLWEECRGRRAYERAICAMPLAYTPGSQSAYSDLGFILLGFILEDLERASLGAQFERVAKSLNGWIGFTPPQPLHPRIAPTENDPWRGRVLRGEVHDENAAALGGAAGHAGVFGTAAAAGSFARMVLSTFQQSTVLGSPDLMREFATRSPRQTGSRALAWDTMLRTSSCGTLMSARAIGHTGFTGTSLWIDPEQDVYVVWLTNRVHPTRANDTLVALRPKLHDAVMQDISAL